MKADKLIETIRTYQERISWIFVILAIMILIGSDLLGFNSARENWINYIWIPIMAVIFAFLACLIEIDRLNWVIQKSKN
jgi:hypothetical protein